MTKTIVETLYPQEFFLSKIEAVGFRFEGYGWSIEDDEECGSQDYFFSFPFVAFEEEGETEGELKLMIEVDEKMVRFDMRVKHGAISEEKRKEISKIIHELASRTPEDMEEITFHGYLIKDLSFYNETINGSNQEKLIEIAKNLEFEKGDGSYDLSIFGLDGSLFAEVLMDMHDGFKVVPFTIPIEYTTELSFKNKTLTMLSQISIARYFSTHY